MFVALVGMIVDPVVSGGAIHSGFGRLVERFRIPLVLADQGLVSAVNFVSTILLARFLGIEDFGRFTLAWMVVLFANSLQYAAIIQPMLSIGQSRGEAEAPAYYGAVIAQQAVAGAIAFAAILIGTVASALVLPDWGIGDLAVPLAVATLAGLAQEFLRRYLFVRGRTVAAVVNDGTRYLSQLILLYVVASRTSDGLTVPIAWVDNGGGQAILGTAHGVLCLDKMTWRSEVLWQTIRRHWHVAKWLLPSTLMGWTAGQAFMMMTGAVLGVATVGMLRAAQTVVGVVHILLLGMDNFASDSRIASLSATRQRSALSLSQKPYVEGCQRGSAAASDHKRERDENNSVDVRHRLSRSGPSHVGSQHHLHWALLSVVLGVWALAIEATEVVFVSLAASTAVAVLVAYPFVVFGGVAGTLSALLGRVYPLCILFTASQTKSFGGGQDEVSPISYGAEDRVREMRKAKPQEAVPC